MGITSDSEYMKIAEAARLLGVTQRSVYRYILSGELPASKIGGLYFINRNYLQALMEARQVEPKDQEQIQQHAPLPRLKCSACYHLLAGEEDIGGECQQAGCSEIICKNCWEQGQRTCAWHSPTREERLREAQQHKQSGQVPLVVQASDARLSEMNLLNRLHAHLKDYTTLMHPISGQAVNISDWDEILEAGDEREQLMRLLGKVVLDSSISAQQPLNAWHHYSIKGKTKKQKALGVHMQVINRIEKMVRDGFDTQPLSREELLSWIEKLIEKPAREGTFQLVLMASTSGWDEAARQVIRGDEGLAFSHRLALLYLYDMARGELIYNNQDDHTQHYAELFRPVLAIEELKDISLAIKDLMGVHDSITLDEAQHRLAYDAEKISQAFKKIGEEDDFVLTEMKGLGSTLVKRQAL